MKTRFSAKFASLVLLTSLLAFPSFMSVANASESDPFPNLANGQEIPGTRVSGQQAITCPAGSGSGVEVNATTGAVYTYCVKTYQSQATINAQALFQTQLASARADALAQSQEWNNAHPGEQKCFPWGPITDPSGGVQSGGECANPVGVVPESPSSSTQPKGPSLPLPAMTDTATATAANSPSSTPGNGLTSSALSSGLSDTATVTSVQHSNSQVIPSPAQTENKSAASTPTAPTAVTEVKAPVASSSKNPISAPFTKHVTIVCVKGTVRKTITGTNPVCPTGYKKH